MRSSDANTRRRTGWKLLGGPRGAERILGVSSSDMEGSTKRKITSQVIQQTSYIRVDGCEWEEDPITYSEAYTVLKISNKRLHTQL